MRISDWSSDVCSSDLRNDGLAYVKGAVQIDAHQAAPIVLRHVGDEFFRIDAGAMHKVINLAITLRNVGGGLFAGLFVGRSEERSGGKECVSTCRSWGWTYV